MRRLAGLLTLLFSLLLAVPAGAQDPPPIVETLRVPTVDGAEVSVEIRRPVSVAKVPIILTYSPYNVINEPEPTNDSLATRYLPKGYARAVADVLGTRNSSGCWDYGGPKEQQSGVDLVNFLAKQPWSNGKVAMIGGSYDGTTANMVAARSADAPGLAAIVPIAAISHWYGYAYYGGVRYSGNSQHPADEGFDTPLGFDFGFGRTPPRDPAAVQAAIDRANPCDSVEHTERGYDTSPDYDDFWLERDYRKDAARFRVPTLLAHGWQDFNVKQDEGLSLYPGLTNVPWRGLFLTQGPHGSPAGPEWEGLLDGFFDRFLLGRADALTAASAVYSTPRDAAGEQPLEKLTSWPPPRTGDVEVRLGRGPDGGTLGTGDGSPASYTDLGTSEETAMQSPGAETAWLAYATEPVREDVRIAGAPALDATIVVDRDHGHLTPTLFDVAPDGTAVPITRGFLNLRYRDGLAKEVPVPAAAPVRAVAGFLPQDWIVRKDHRIVLTIASSNTAWAVPDQPGLGVEIRHGGASRLLVPVVGAGAATPIVGARPPAEPLPTARTARRGLRLKVRRLRGHRLRITGRAPRGVRVRLAVRRGKRVVARRTVRARSGRFRVVVRIHRGGRYRVTAAVRTRDGLVTKRSRAVAFR